MSHNPIQEIIDTTQGSEREGYSSGSEAEHRGNSPDAPQPSSSKRKKKKKSKIPQSVVDNVIQESKEQDGGVASESREAEAVMQALNHLKLMDSLKGKVSTTGKNTLGEHKV